MKTIKTITFSLPVEMGNDIEKMAEQEQRTVSELIREAIRQYRSQKTFKSLAPEVKAAAKKKGSTPKDFEIPANEAWLFAPENKHILEQVKEGLRQKGTIKRGSFSKHLK